MMSLWDALRMNMMISYQELVRTFLSVNPWRLTLPSYVHLAVASLPSISNVIRINILFINTFPL